MPRRNAVRLALCGLLAVGLLLSPALSAQEAPILIAPAAPLAAPAQTAPALPPAEAVTAQDAIPPAAPPSESPADPPANPDLPRDLSPIGMFLGADIVVQLVMVGLVFASVLTWTVWLVKWLELSVVLRRTRKALRLLGEAASLGDALRMQGFGKGPATQMLRAAAIEARLSADVPGPGLKDRVASRLQGIEVAAARSAMRGTGVIATIASTAPFVGLFGTVWGIMNSFIGISKSQTTNLAVVAPGIAEALLATALGLVAAIPAVVTYNMFARGMTGYRAALADVSAEIQRLVSRDLDRRLQGRAEAAE
jgi:biopolymer transport protein ExbB